MLAKAIVEDSEVIFINTRISNLMSKWFDDAQKLGEYGFKIIALLYILKLAVTHRLC